MITLREIILWNEFLNYNIGCRRLKNGDDHVYKKIYKKRPIKQLCSIHLFIYADHYEHYAIIYLNFLVFPAIKTGRYTYEKRTKDTVEVRKMKVAEKPRQMETYISDSEVDQIIQSLKEVLLKSCPEAHTIFDRETNLNRQWQIYVRFLVDFEISWVNVVRNSPLFLHILKVSSFV